MERHKLFDGNAIPRRILSGLKSFDALPEQIDVLDVNRVLVITDPIVREKTDLVGRAQGLLGEKLSGVFDRVKPHAPIEVIREAAEYARSVDADSVLSLGGGAVHDTAKAVALMAASGMDIKDLASHFEPPDGLRTPAIEAEPLPLITVPTTMSAAEVVGGGAFTDTETGLKHIFVHAMLVPRLVVQDGELLATIPLKVLLPSAMNTLHHCVEAICSRGNLPITDALALGSIRILMKVIPNLAMENVPDRAAWCQQALDASGLSGLTYGNSWLGVGHAICHSLGGRYGLSHGEANTVIMPHAMRFNLPFAAERLAMVAWAMGGGFNEDQNMEAANHAVTVVENLIRGLGLPETLRELGLPEGQAEAIAGDVMTDPQTFWNPRRVTRSDLVELLENAW